MAEISFEKALGKLEEIVEELEGGDLPLDEALKKYEEGIRLARVCTKKLETAQKKIEILVKAENGQIELKLFDEKKAIEDEKE